MLIPLGDIDSGDDELICFGINNHGEIVGLRQQSDTQSPFEAVLWLPFDAYGEDAGLHRIDVLTSFAAGGQANDGTIAFDINDDGIAVGRAHDDADLDAIIWDFGSSSYTLLPDRFNAFSINDDSPAKVVGGSGDYWEYRLSSLPGTPSAASSFIHIVGGSTNDLDVASDYSGVAFGIAETVGTSDAHIAGLGNCVDSFCPDPPCLARWDGLYWNDHGDDASALSPFAIVNPGGHSGFVLGHAVEGVPTDTYYPVGFGYDGEDTQLCRWFALMWLNGPGSAPIDLPLLVSQSLHTEMALDVRSGPDAGDFEVVGRNWTLGTAVRWRYDASQSSWSVVELIEEVENPANFDELECATGINDDGWIVAWGPIAGTSLKYRSAALVPCDAYREARFCPADIVGQTSQCPNGAVDVFDLLTVLENWAGGGLGAAISSDGGGAGVVDVFDLLDVLAQWGDCPHLPGQTVLSLETEVTGAGLTMNDWDDFYDVMTDDNAPVKVKENHACWMKNYLSGCTTCPPCPDADPFD